MLLQTHIHGSFNHADSSLYHFEETRIRVENMSGCWCNCLQSVEVQEIPLKVNEALCCIGC
ncbi:hypothetical protein [Escherichia phage ZCEC13]|uniref:Uncharacterized protein n=1 Tax=Escherichia phage ZCEC13 TaxID=2935866 RepID=A0AAE9HK58_9CAUD|nr:hypothetical protein [Escherichia phage ZCEC13]